MCALVSGVGGLKWVLALMTIAGSAASSPILLISSSSSSLLLPSASSFSGSGHSEVRLDLLPIARATTGVAGTR